MDSQSHKTQGEEKKSKEFILKKRHLKANAPTQATNKLKDYSDQFLESLSMTKTQSLIVCEQNSLAWYLQWTQTVLNNQILFPLLVDRCCKGPI